MSIVTDQKKKKQKAKRHIHESRLPPPPSHLFSSLGEKQLFFAHIGYVRGSSLLSVK